MTELIEQKSPDLTLPKAGRGDRALELLNMGITLAASISGGVSTAVASLLFDQLKTPLERRTEEWMRAHNEKVAEICSALDRLDPSKSMRLSKDATLLLFRLLQSSDEGMAHEYKDLQQIAVIVPELPDHLLVDAAHDLAQYDLAIVMDTANYWGMCLEGSAFQRFDTCFMDWNTTDDAVELARLMLAESCGGSQQLCEQLAWPSRRFNPAFREILPAIPEQMIRGGYRPGFDHVGVVLCDRGRAGLRKLIEQCGS